MTTLTFAQTSVPACSRGSGHGPGEVPWSGESLCWDCVDPLLDLLAKAAEYGQAVTVCQSTGSPQAGGDWRDTRDQRRMAQLPERMRLVVPRG